MNCFKPSAADVMLRLKILRRSSGASSAPSTPLASSQNSAFAPSPFAATTCPPVTRRPGAKADVQVNERPSAYSVTVQSEVACRSVVLQRTVLPMARGPASSRSRRSNRDAQRGQCSTSANTVHTASGDAAMSILRATRDIRSMLTQQLGIACLARLVAEDDVVVAVRVEGRVEVDQVDGGIGQVATQDVEVVAVVEDVGGEVGHRSPEGLAQVGA